MQRGRRSTAVEAAVFVAGAGTDHMDTAAIDPDRLEFELQNVGPGPDPLSLSALAADNDFVVVLLQRDHYCTNCREQVQAFAERYGEFEERNAEVVSVVPEPREKVRGWQDSYDLPFPLLADPDAGVGESSAQPVRVGVLGRISDFFGRMPEAVVLDVRGENPEIAWGHRGSSTFDRPEIDDVLSAIDDAIQASGRD
jgi:peroxiredoxin Q/BCP